jgi:hypothetical protein
MAEVFVKHRLGRLAGDGQALSFQSLLKLAPETPARGAIGVVVGADDVRNGDGRVVGEDPGRTSRRITVARGAFRLVPWA